MMLRYLLLTAVRDRLMLAMLAALAAVWLLAAFAGGTSVVEDRAASIVFAGFAARLVVVLGIVLFTALHVRRLNESRELYLILSKPVSRAAFVAAYGAGLALLGVLLAIAAGAAVAVAGWIPPAPAGLAAWTASLAVETAVMAAFALFVTLGGTSPLGGMLAALGFYALARMLGVLLAIVRSELRGAGGFNAWVDGSIEVLGLVLPRLDLFADSRWLVHGIEAPETLALLVLQGAAYAGLLAAAAVFDVTRRRF